MSVRVEINVQTDTARRLQLQRESNEALVLRCVACGETYNSKRISLSHSMNIEVMHLLTFVRLRARVRGSSTSGRPLVRPVTVDISTHAGAGADSLAILAPQAIGSLRVDEAVRVDDREDVIVELVDDSLDSRVGAVFGEELVRNVLHSHGRDPTRLLEAAQSRKISFIYICIRTILEHAQFHGRAQRASIPCLHFPKCEYPAASFLGQRCPR